MVGGRRGSFCEMKYETNSNNQTNLELFTSVESAGWHSVIYGGSGGTDLFIIFIETPINTSGNGPFSKIKEQRDLVLSSNFLKVGLK